jgi:membrane fusion protein (multidrug efflux system)
LQTAIIRTVALVSALVIGAWLPACGKKPEAPAAAQAPAQGKPPAGGAAPATGGGGPPKGLPVKAVPVKVGTVTNEVTAVGTLLAEESVIIRPEIDGRVLDLHFREGQGVARGAKLVTLDASEVMAQLAAAEAQVRTDAQRLERTKELLDQKFISQDAYDVAKNNYERSVAVRDEIRARLDKTVIRAPFPGVVGLRMVSPGAYVKKGDDIVRLENIASIKLDFRVPELFVARLKVGQPVAIRLDAFPSESFSGRIYAVEPVVDERTRTILARARVTNAGFKLKPGMFVRVALTLETRQNAILVPEPAIWPQGQDNFVYRVIEGKALLTKIQTGLRRPGEVEVVAGLSPGDMVITEGQIKMRDGMPVMVLPAAPPAPTASAAPAPGQAGGAISGPGKRAPAGGTQKKG